MAHDNPFEIKTKSDGSYFGQPTSRSLYTNPKLAVSPIFSAGGEKTSAIGSGETSENINSALEQLQDDPTGFNRNLNKRIKRADNIAQQTRLNIKLDKKKQRQEKRAQKMLDKNPEYVNRTAEEAAQGNAKKAMLEQVISNPMFHLNK